MLIDYLSNGEFVNRKDVEFLANWISIVATAETNTADLEWIQDINTELECCGWIDANSEAENPAYLDCDATVNTAICGDVIGENLNDFGGRFGVVAVVLTSLQVASLSVSFALVCRLKQFYHPQTVDYGDYVHLEFGKVKQLDDLTQ
jgi:hypothetical protein